MSWECDNDPFAGGAARATPCDALVKYSSVSSIDLRRTLGLVTPCDFLSAEKCSNFRPEVVPYKVGVGVGVGVCFPP